MLFRFNCIFFDDPKNTCFLFYSRKTILPMMLVLTNSGRLVEIRKTRSKARGFVEFKNLKVLLIRKETRIVRVQFYRVYSDARALCVNTPGFEYVFFAKPFRRKIFLHTRKKKPNGLIHNIYTYAYCNKLVLCV